MIGINNVPQGESPNNIASDIQQIIQKIRKESPCTENLDTKVYYLLPQNTTCFKNITSHWQEIPDINQAIFNI